MDAATDIILPKPCCLRDLFHRCSRKMFIAPKYSSNNSLKLINWNIERIFIRALFRIDNNRAIIGFFNLKGYRDLNDLATV